VLGDSLPWIIVTVLQCLRYWTDGCVPVSKLHFEAALTINTRHNNEIDNLKLNYVA